VQLKNVVPWGRSLQEYREMFGLCRSDFDKTILGCSDGPASFNAELRNKGFRCISVDPLYRLPAETIRQRIREVYPVVLEQLIRDAAQFLWTSHETPEELARYRMAAMDIFLNDYQQGKQEGRYLCGCLPDLPFADASFALALCSHYLFLYSSQKDLAHHIEAMVELCRVAEEVRVYPLVTLAGTPSPHLTPVTAALHDRGITTQIVPVPYRFQRGATEMLVARTQSQATGRTGRTKHGS